MSVSFNFPIEIYKGRMNNSTFKWHVNFKGVKKAEINMEVIYSNFNNF